MPLILAQAGEVLEPESYNDTVADIMATPESVMGFVVVAVIMIVSMLSAVGAILSFLFTMSFFRLPEEHRKMPLGRIWLIMTPFFGVYWMYVVVKRLADSFRSYFAAQLADEKDIPDIASGDLGLRFGMAMVGAAVVAHLTGLLLYTKSPVAIGVGLGLGALLALVTSGLYFYQVFRIREHIPDPEVESVPESYI